MVNVNYRHKMHFEKSYLKICCFRSLGALFLTLSPPSAKNWFLCLFRIMFLFFLFLSPNLFHLILFCFSFNSFIQIYSLFSLYYEIFMFWMKTQTIELFPLFIKRSCLYNSLNVFQTMRWNCPLQPPHAPSFSLPFPHPPGGSLLWIS